MSRLYRFLTAIFCFIFVTVIHADVTVHMFLTAPKGEGKEIGTVILKDTRYGLLLTPNLAGLSPGLHGFHVHDRPNCGDSGMAAGGHLDPQHSGKHLGPYNEEGHLGDLPVLMVDKDGNATTPVLAPRLKIANVMNHALMIHEGGDNYSDNPPMGGGGARVACGVIK